MINQAVDWNNSFCQTCRFWYEEEPDMKKNRQGKCRAKAPLPGDWPTDIPVSWPTTRGKDFCGEWQQKGN